MMSVVRADATGKIAGQVTDAVTGESLQAVNVIVDGTMLGAAADQNGDYFILNIPPGEYVLRASMIGYDVTVVTNVLVQVNLTTRINIALTPTILEGQVVVIVAERPVVELGVASTQSILTGEELGALPLAQFKNIVDTQMGIRDVDSRGIFIRGSRQSAVSLMLDGAETRDNVDNQIYTRVNPDEVEQVEILTGGFDAEHGNATAGVISVVTKEGGNSYSGTFDTRIGLPHRKHFGPPLKNYYDQHFDNDSLFGVWAAAIDTSSPYAGFRDQPALLKELYDWRMRDEITTYGDKPDLNIGATFGGPLPFFPRTTFFTSARYERTYYLYPGAIDHYGDSGFMAKVTSQIVPSMKLNLTYRYTETVGVNRYDREHVMENLGIMDASDPASGGLERRFVYDGVAPVAWDGMGGWPYMSTMSISERFRQQYGLSLTHTLTPSTFYEISIRYSNFRVHGAPADQRDTTATVTLKDAEGNAVTLSGEYADAPLDYWPIRIRDPWSQAIGGSQGSFETSRDKNLSIRASITSQVTKNHQVKSGVHFTYTDLFKEEYRRGSDGRYYAWNWHVDPKHLGLWISDKIEWEGMIATLGLRADAKIPDGDVPDIVNQPYHYSWSEDLPDSLVSVGTGPHYAPPTQWVLAPRLNVSHPIGEAAKIFFNYGHYYQEPPLERQYYFMERYDRIGSRIFGNPELPFQKTVQFEIGYEQSILDIFRISISSYSRDNTKLVNDDIEYTGRFDHWYHLSPTDSMQYYVGYTTYNANYYQAARGLQFRLEKRGGTIWKGWFNYDYEIFSRGRFGFNSFWEDTTRASGVYNYAYENRTTSPMPRFNLGVDIFTPAEFGLHIGRFYPVGNLTLSLLYWWRSQPTITYNPDRLRRPYDPRDNMRWKPHSGTNMVLQKRFVTRSPVTPLLYVEIYNVFNTKNMFRGAFGNHLDSYIELLEEHGGELGEREDLAMQAIWDPEEYPAGPASTPYHLFLNPREIWIGIRFEL
jgi:hypothetical protein